MKLRLLVVLGSVAVLTGCTMIDNLCEKVGFAKNPPTYNQYHLSGWPWDGVARVVVLPFVNESENTRAGDEVRAAFVSEFQRLGRFEVVALRADDRAAVAVRVHHSGEFDEAALIDLAHEHARGRRRLWRRHAVLAVPSAAAARINFAVRQPNAS